MADNALLFELMCQKARSLCDTDLNASIISVSDITFDPKFRDMCAANMCGKYGRCWTCPPFAGEVDQLISRAKLFEYALVYQMIFPLEDSFDYEGMVDAKAKFTEFSVRFRKLFDGEYNLPALHLSAGGCGICEKCAKISDEPCRFPSLAISSLEAYCIDVSRLAKSAGMKYINGVNTVTYFGAVLFNT